MIRFLQAVIYPVAIPKVMDETQIRKARMLGGKLGKKVGSMNIDADDAIRSYIDKSISFAGMQFASSF